MYLCISLSLHIHLEIYLLSLFAYDRISSNETLYILSGLQHNLSISIPKALVGERHMTDQNREVLFLFFFFFFFNFYVTLSQVVSDHDW